MLRLITALTAIAIIPAAMTSPGLFLEESMKTPYMFGVLTGGLGCLVGQAIGQWIVKSPSSSSAESSGSSAPPAPAPSSH